MPFRTATLTAATALAACAAVLGGTAGAGATVPPPRDHLTVTVRDAGGSDPDRTYELRCHPTGGNHPKAQAACDKLDSVTVWGKDPFAPTPKDSLCTGLYGGPATAHVEGVWAGRPVDADFSRGDGCETARWNDLVPLLPRTSF